MRKVFGEESIAAIEAQFDDVYRLSFNDNSIIENPDKFAEAIQYAFGASSTLIMAEINRKLAGMLGLDLRSNSELIESASYGFHNFNVKNEKRDSSNRLVSLLGTQSSILGVEDRNLRF